MTEAAKNRKLGYLSFTLAAVVYGIFGLFVRVLEIELDIFQQIALRSIFAVVIALVWLLLSGRSNGWSSFRSFKVWGFGLLFPGSVILWTMAVVQGNIRTAVFGLYLGSLLSSVFFGWRFFREKLNALDVISVLLALLGCLIFSVPLVQLSSSCLFLGIVAGIIQAFNLCYRRWLGDIERSVVVAVQSIGGLFVSLILCSLTSQSVSTISTSTLFVGAAYGGAIVLASYLLLVGTKNLELNKGAVILSTELVWATLAGALFLGEIPTSTQLLGTSILIFAAAVGKFK